ncbi:MAG: MBL fold metallo-hydrolase [Candidatus Marinimicrobia bacterium]|nr:MBL fold metallo-hydrolase [Candidatus Neomarinimicrobiota bacterium]MCF7830233.1 MBL fold metallo-hydrolase [Candidatus Neomarinimicrobiota bacterium]MCF7882260.1 MBL fold metallo-hydrolase [Candidatus Neomarinimicrobiota bacterium]
MDIKFWGVRGSIPTPPTPTQIRQKMLNVLRLAQREKLESDSDREKFLESLNGFQDSLIGGNTSCVQVTVKDNLFIFDMGSGLKRLGNALTESEAASEGLAIHFFISHTHWDHMMGFPFFTPAYLPQHKIIFHSPIPDLEERIRAQQDFRFFPVSLDDMASTKEFHTLQPEGKHTIEGVTIRTKELNHPGNSYGYRVESDGKSFVYTTDSEFKDLSQMNTKQYTDFFQDADVLTFDSQYTLLEAVHHKKDWGHSSAIIGIDLAAEAGVKTMVLFHHEPENDDSTIQSLRDEAQQYKSINYPDSPLSLIIGHEGLEISL